MNYVDGFIVPVPVDKLETYRELASVAGEVWLEHGALSYLEAVADDAPMGEVTSFPRSVQQKEDETVVFSFITYRSREHRDEVLKKCMEDPRLKHEFDKMPFDAKRMIYGGFKPIVQMLGSDLRQG